MWNGHKREEVHQNISSSHNKIVSNYFHFSITHSFGLHLFCNCHFKVGVTDSLAYVDGFGIGGGGDKAKKAQQGLILCIKPMRWSQ